MFAEQATDTLSAEDLRKIDNQTLLDAVDASGWASQSRIVIDGWVLPESPAQTFGAGRQANVPVLLGSTANEGHLLFPVNEQLSRADFDAYVSNTFGELGNQVTAAYADELAIPGCSTRDRYRPFYGLWHARLGGLYAASKRIHLPVYDGARAASVSDLLG